jgi:hypothetical protein
MNGERIIKFAGQGSVYIRCLEPLEEEDDEDLELLQPVFSDDDALESQVTAEILSSPDEVTVTQPATTSQDISYHIPEELPTFNHEEEIPVFEDDEIPAIYLEEQLTASIDNIIVDSNDSSTPAFSSNPTTNHQEMPIRIIKVRRSLIREDMLQIFSDPSILNASLFAVIINQLGHQEVGEGTGVLTEVFSLFWKESYESYMLGETERVPYIRHDFNRGKWEAVGRILVKGYTDCRYFPYQLSKVFFIACLFGEDNVTNQMLHDSFKHYLSYSEAGIVDACLNNNISCEDDELLEFLSAFDCKRRITENNMKDIITEVAHKEIIQKPQYVADCWGLIVSDFKKYFPDVCSINKLYESIVPTNVKVISILQASPVTPAEGETLAHIKRFIRGLDEGKLATFLRFTTASDMLLTDTLKIVFNSYEGLQRRPVAHTCGYTLEVPSTYSSFCELREEFMGILSADGWEMNIV